MRLGVQPAARRGHSDSMARVVAATVEEIGENRVRLTVEVSPDQVHHAVEHAVSDLSESVKLPGFRKGKIPTPVLVSRLGKERIYAEAVESHIRGWFWNAATRSRVRPVADPQYEFELPSAADEAWSFAATVDVQPLPDIVDWTTLEVPRDTVVELGTGRLAPELEAAILGATAGETKQSSYELPDGSQANVEVTVQEIQEKVLPEVDDELARAASEFETLAELRASIEATLRSQLDAEIDSAFRSAAVDELVRASQVQPARPLVSSRAGDLLTAFARSLERRGVSLEVYLQASGGSSEQLQRQMVLEAAVSIARELALEALADRAGIEVSEDEVKAYLREEAEQAGEDADALVEDVWAHGQQESIREDLRLRAALERLAADVKPIAPEVADAREKLWTPDKEKTEADTKLWTPGSKEPA